jgi:Rrf2 family protein
MRITNLAEYGVICALHLARRASDGAVSGREIAESERLPADYVEQIMLRLRRAGVVRSTRGAHGGYQLARHADQIANRHECEPSEETPFQLESAEQPDGEDRSSS